MSEHHPPSDRHDDEHEDYLGPSKSAEKREAHAAQALGVGLAELDSDALDRLPISDRLRAGIEQLKATRSRGAAKRQRQYIGRLMREEDVEGIEAGLRRLDPNSPENQRVFQQAEQWRTALIEDPDATTRFVERFPGVDVQHLRQMQRTARAEVEKQRPGKHYRALFQEIRAQVEQAEQESEQDDQQE
ncbi:MAG: ribosome biogenesis factor YjgA [Guyparkeria sp.]